MSQIQKQKSQSFLVNYFSNYMTNFIGGPKIIQARYLINFQKGATFFFVLFLMYYYKNYSLGSVMYLVLHGSYGFLWLLKDIAFGDKSFNQKCTIPSFLLICIVLLMYWYIPFLQISGVGIQNPSIYRISTAFLFYIFGVNIMLASDCQKYFTLKYKKGLICEGMFYYSRNPNYLGEIMLYSSFAILVGDLRAWVILLSVWGTAFNMNMYLKDETSLKLKDGWDVYSKRSGKLLFKFWENDIIHFGFYGFITALGYYLYNIC